MLNFFSKVIFLVIIKKKNTFCFFCCFLFCVSWTEWKLLLGQFLKSILSWVKTWSIKVLIKYFSDCNGTRTHNHLLPKRTLNHLAKLSIRRFSRSHLVLQILMLMPPLFGATFAKLMTLCVKVHKSLQFFYKFVKESHLVEMFSAFSNFNSIIPSSTV